MKKKSILFSFPPKRRLKFTPKNIFFFFFVVFVFIDKSSMNSYSTDRTYPKQKRVREYSSVFKILRNYMYQWKFLLLNEFKSMHNII